MLTTDDSSVVSMWSQRCLEVVFKFSSCVKVFLKLPWRCLRTVSELAWNCPKVAQSCLKVVPSIPKLSKVVTKVVNPWRRHKPGSLSYFLLPVGKPDLLETGANIRRVVYFTLFCRPKVVLQPEKVSQTWELGPTTINKVFSPQKELVSCLDLDKGRPALDALLQRGCPCS